MLAAYSDLFVWNQIPIIVLLLVAWIFGLSGLLYVGIRFIAKASEATYRQSVGAILLIGLFSLIGGVAGFFYFGMFFFSFVVIWLLIRAMFKISFGKAILAWLPMFAGQLLVTILFFVAVISPIQNRARVLAKRAICQMRLKGLGTAIESYHQEYNVYPPSPKEFVEGGYASSKNFHCPSDIQDREISFFYLPPLETDEGETFVMCDLKGNHEDIRNVLREKGDVQELSEEEFQAELAKPYNARFAEALKKAEGQ